METTPFYFSYSENGQKLHPVDSTKGSFDEAWLQEFLRQHPEALPTASIEPIYSPLIPIGREVVVSNGAIDNLYISKQGYPVLVETKLWRNPEARREVLTQTIEYGSALSKLSYEDLDGFSRKYTKNFEGKAYHLVDWIEQNFGPIEEGSTFFEETVSRNLRLGRFLILIVGDRIRQSLAETLSFMNRYPHLATDVALVELLCFQIDQQHDWPMVIIPNLMTRTEIVERSIVQVNVDAKGTYTVDVSQEKAKSKGGRRKRVKLASEDAYWEILKETAPQNFEPARKVIKYFQDNDLIRTDPKQSSLAVYLDLPESGQMLSLFFIDKAGVVTCWISTLRDQLERGSYDVEITREYDHELGKVLRKRTKKLAMYEQASKIDLNAFKEIVDRFIEKVLQSEPKES